MLAKLTPKFTFAGFNFPRYVYQLPKQGLRKKRELRKCCGPYYHAPVPNNAKGMFFYLGSDFSPRRWEWCDDAEGIRYLTQRSIKHTGWYCDDYCDSKIRGIVVTLNHSRGFLAGWSMGEGMASQLDSYIYSTKIDAAHAADGMAEYAAEEERSYQERWREEECLGSNEEETEGY